MKLVYAMPVGPNLYMMQEVTGQHPDQGLPGMPPYPDQGLPGYPGHPDHGLPAIPGVPDNTLPTTPPPSVPPGSYLVMVRDPSGKWTWAVVPTAPTQLPTPPPTAQPKA